jgi:hypothetical protein
VVVEVEVVAGVLLEVVLVVVDAPPVTCPTTGVAVVDVVVVFGTDTCTLTTAPVVMTVVALPDTSSTENEPEALSVTTACAPAFTAAVAAIVHREDVDCTTASILERPVSTKSLCVTVEQSIASFADNVNDTAVPTTFADTADSVKTGAVTSAIVTVTAAGEPAEIVRRLFPYASSTENDCDARSELVPEEPGETDDVAVIVQRVDVVWTIASI